MKQNLKKNGKNAAKILAFAGIAVLAGTFLSCNEKSSKKSAAKYSLKMGYQTSTPFISPLVQIAEEKGYLDEYGLKIERQVVDRSGSFEAVSVGKLDFITFELVPHLSYGAQGADEIIFGGTVTGGMTVFSTKKYAEELKNSNDLSNWKGKTIGVKLLSTSELVSKSVLRDYGYKIDDEIKYKFFEGDEPLIAAAVKGQVDIAFISSFYVDTAEAQGLVYLYPEIELQNDYICCRQVSNGTSFKKNQEAYKALLKGEIRAYKEYLTDEEGAIATIQRATKQDEQFVRDYFYNPKTSQGQKYNPDPGYNKVLSDYEIMLDWNYVPQGTPLDSFYNIDLYATALQEVIAEFPDDQFYKDAWAYFLENNNKYPNFSYQPL